MGIPRIPFFNTLAISLVIKKQEPAEKEDRLRSQRIIFGRFFFLFVRNVIRSRLLLYGNLQFHILTSFEYTNIDM